jgi:DNA adenine methylase
MKKIYAPFRWAGSKAKLTNELFSHFKDNKIYVEPFLGSGVVLFRLLQENRYDKYIVNDINVSIITFYKAIQQDVDIVVSNLIKMRDAYNGSIDKQAFYYAARTRFNEDKSNYLLFWLLMKAGFNGLYRENKKGFYNAPSGKKEKITLDTNMIYEISKLIQNVEFYNMDYRDFYLMLETNKDMFVYNDPPYCNSQKFTAEGFDNHKFASFLEDVKCDIAISDIDSESSNTIYQKFTKRFIKEQKRVINILNISKIIEVLYVNY